MTSRQGGRSSTLGVGPLGGLQDASKGEAVGRLVAGVTAEEGVSKAVTFETAAKT